MMMMMPRKTMAHIKTDPAAPATDAAPRASASNFVQKPLKLLFTSKPTQPHWPRMHEFFDEKPIKFLFNEIANTLKNQECLET